MAADDKREPIDRLAEAYERMLERVDELLGQAEKSTIPTLRKSLEQARERAVELNELTREEAEKIAGYLERDMQDAAQFLSDTGEQLRAWWQFDLKLIENNLLDMFANVADKTRLELQKLADQAREASYYRTGEVTGPGTLVCTECGKALHFHQAGHIPPCPECRGTRYRRDSSAR